MKMISHTEAAQQRWDVLIIGGGFASGVLCRALTGSGKRVLVVEAGTGQLQSYEEHLGYLERYATSLVKVPNAPFPNSPHAPQPLETDVRPIQPGHPSGVGYFVQEGPHPFESTYTRRMGGTSLHWFGSCPRMLPEDFEMQRRFGRGADWPLAYDDLLPFYALAERELGVSADVEDQRYLGLHFPEGYVYPMHRIPPSYLDQWMDAGLRGMDVGDGPLMIRSIPQARNSVPNAAYDGGRGYHPVGAVGNPSQGQRCMGNSNCLPLCPIQARYNVLKSFAVSEGWVVNQTVASRLEVDGDNGRIVGVRCKKWFDEGPSHEEIALRGDTVVLAANAIENAMLLHASELCRSSDQVGRNLMDHPAILCWGLAPRSVGAFRGPGLTSTMVTYRGGDFRRGRAGIVLEIGNWGWQWPINEPTATTQSLVDSSNLFGAALRARLGHIVPRQIRLDLIGEQLPDPNNRVICDPAQRDRLGNLRPVIRYDVDAYTQDGLIFGRRLTQQIFARLGIEDHTVYSASDPGAFERAGEIFSWSGVGHIAGTHRMGLSPRDSVVDKNQKAWDHDNLYVIGCGVMPTLGTSNPTLTMAALIFATAQHLQTRRD